MKNWMKVLLFCLTSLMFIGCDRITKDLAKQHLMYREPLSYLHNTVRLEYVENTGAALSLGDQLSKPLSFWLLSILPLLFLLILAAYTIKNVRLFSPLKMLALSLIVAGGLGNIIDRLLYDRHVTDFMNVGIQNVRTGIFNVADVCVTTGVILFLVFYKEHKPVLDNGQPNELAE
ncbi:MAG: signal peptidase II [Mucilaginibacter sp.]